MPAARQHRVMAGKRRGEIEPLDAARIEESPMAGTQLGPDGTGDDIARREFRARHILHEAAACFIDQNRAFAPHGLADEAQLRARRVERGRMKLHEFEIGAASRRPARRWPAPGPTSPTGLVPCEKSPPTPPVAMTTRLVRKEDCAIRAFGDQAGDLATLDAEAPRRKAFEDRDGGRGADGGRQGAHDLAAGLVAAGVDDAVAAMRGFEAEFQAAIGRAVEAHAKPRADLRSRRGRRR